MTRRMLAARTRTRTRTRAHARALAGAAALAALAIPTVGAAVAATPAAPLDGVRVIAAGLDQPKKLTPGPGGSLLVAISGDGRAPAACTTGAQPSCLDHSGAIDEVGRDGGVRTLLGGLPSVSSGAGAGVASGPAQARLVGGRLQVLFQDSAISARTGAEPYGPGGHWLGDLVRFPTARGGARREADFGRFEAAHNPDHGVGTTVARRQESAVDSDPYAFVPYRGGYAVADAGANDVLFVGRSGRISVLAVLPTIRERAPARAFGPAQTRPISARAQAVPDALAVGPDGALYVGELGGTPSAVGRSAVYRIAPGRRPSVYARGLTAIGDLAFDRTGRLLVLEIDRRGLADPALLAGRTPTSGAVIRIGPHGRRRLLASTGLQFPTGIAVAHNGTVYVATNGISDATAGNARSGGQIVALVPR